MSGERLVDINLEEIMKTGLEASPDSFGVMCGDENRVLYCNRAFADIFGLPKEEVLGNSANELLRKAWKAKIGVVIDTQDIEKWLEELNTIHKDKEMNRFECDLYDGRWFQMTRMNLDGGIRIMFGSDITALKQAHQSLEEANIYIEKLANTDTLTGVCNRRYFEATAEKEFSRARRYNQALSFLILDIDYFKRINDLYGHETGDAVLKSFSGKCSDIVRNSDTLCRIGGEEFAVILPVTRCSDAKKLAERIRQRVFDSEFPVVSNQKALNISVSIGVAGVVESDQSYRDVLSRADVALYAAKDGGRNRVVVAET